MAESYLVGIIGKRTVNREGAEDAEEGIKHRV